MLRRSPLFSKLAPISVRVNNPRNPRRAQLQGQGAKGGKGQQQQEEEEDEHCSWAAVQALLPHWASLPDERKTLFAQMADVTL